MIITKERRSVRLLAFRKSAHTTILNSFCNNDAVIKRGANGYQDMNTASITVMFLRNPLARLVSAYHHLIAGGETLHEGLRKLGYVKKMPFAEFLDQTMAISDADQDWHLKSQRWQISRAQEKHHTAIMWVGRVEHLWRDWLEMLEFTGLDIPEVLLPNFNARKHPPWPTYYTSEQIQRALRHRFSEDFHIWQTRVWR